MKHADLVLQKSLTLVLTANCNGATGPGQGAQGTPQENVNNKKWCSEAFVSCGRFLWYRMTGVRNNMRTHYIRTAVHKIGKGAHDDGFLATALLSWQCRIRSGLVFLPFSQSPPPPTQVSNCQSLCRTCSFASSESSITLVHAGGS